MIINQIENYIYIQKSQSMPDWNQIEGSSEEDSWDDDPKPAVKQQQNSQKTQGQSKQSQQGEKTVPQKPKFLSDEELLTKFKNKEIGESRKIKVVRCNNKELLDEAKNVKFIKEISPTNYIITFLTEEDVINFIEQKINNKYRFYLHEVYPSKNNYKEAKRNYAPKDAKYEPKYDNAKYEKHDNHKNYSEKPKQHKQNPYSEKKEPRDHAKQERKVCFNLHENNLKIIAEGFDTQKIINALKNAKVFKEFTCIHVYTPEKYLDDVRILVDAISVNFSFWTASFPKKSEEGKESIQILLKEGVKGKTEGKNRSENKIRSQNKIESKQSTRRLASKAQDYFSNIAQTNKNILLESCDIAQYLKKLGDNIEGVFYHWNKWVLKAQGANISKLLQLNHLVKASFINMGMQLRVGSHQDIPQMTLQLIREANNPAKVQKQKRFKVDTSMVNSYLNN